MWTETQKEIVKGCYGEYAGQLLDYKLHGQYRERYFDFSRPNQRSVHVPEGFTAPNIMQTENTDRVCRGCQGNGWTYVIMKGFGDLIVRRECGQCHGTRMVHG